MVQSQGLRIGAVARQAGVSVDTVRYYERRGLVRPEGRLSSGYRVYTAAAVARIRLARQLQGLGMTLEDVADLLRAHDAGGDCASECWRLEVARDRVATEMARLARVAADLDSVLAHCAEGRCDLLPSAAAGHRDR
jgi:DNA-binding transcriptional MerR regulator